MRRIAFLIALCALPAAAQQPPDKALADKAVAAVKRVLKDPYSAKFESLQRGHLPNNIVCGFVNSKNGYGAYGGRKAFYYLSAKGAPILAMEGDPDYEHTIPSMCPNLR